MAKNQTDSIAKQIHMKLEKMMDALLKSNMEWRPELYKKYGEDGETPNSDTIAAIEVVESEDKRAVSELKASPTSSASQDLTRVMTVVERYIEETASAYSDVARLSDEQDSAKVRSIIEHRQHLAKYLNETKTFLAGLPELRLSEPDNELFWLLDVSSDVHKLTTKLLLGPLNDPIDLKRLAKVTVIGLINAWEQAVKTHATPFTASDPQQTTSNIAALFFVHKLLQEKLYKNLNSTIIQQQPVTIQF